MSDSSTPVGTSTTSDAAGAASVSRTSGYVVSRRGLGRSSLVRCVRAVRLLAFWVAVMLPCYAIWLLFGGLSAAETPLFVATVLFDCSAFVVGHNHRSPSVATGRFTR